MEGVLLWFAVGLLAAGVVGLSLIVYQLLRQQGRLLLRVEQLEGALAGGQQAPASEMPRGLAIGSQVPPFELPSVAGETVSLDDFRGRRVALVHWSPGCGFCTQIADELASLRGQLRKRGTELVLVSSGDADSNRSLAKEHGLDCSILLQDGAPIEVFTGLGTPVAYLVDEEGRVAEPLALGALEVPELLRAAADGRKRLGTERSLAESHLERDGLAPGTKAPTFELDDVRGGKILLEDYRGRRLLLVFSDPDCGPCNALLPDLARLQSDIEIVMVSRGDADTNRAKAEEHGLEFPLIVQLGWKLSKAYGIFATPVAFLIDEEGVIARPVARGRDEIVALAQAAPAGKEAELAL